MEPEFSRLSCVDAYSLFFEQEKLATEIADEHGLPLRDVEAMIERGREAARRGLESKFACQVMPLDFISQTRNGVDCIHLIVRARQLLINRLTYARLIDDRGRMFLFSDTRPLHTPYANTHPDFLPEHWRFRYQKAQAECEARIDER